MKHRLLISIIILLFTCSLSAQETRSKFRIGLTTSLVENLSDDTIEFDQYQGLNAEYDKTNYRLGVTLEYELGEKSSVNTAINYSNMDFTSTFYCEVCDFEVLPSPQDADLSFIEIPVTLKYYFLKNTLRPFAEVGVTNLFLLEEDIITNSYVLSATIGGGLEYAITERIALQAAVDYNQGVTNLFKESDYKLKTLAFGIGVMVGI